jgi:hypothetical protein
VYKTKGLAGKSESRVLIADIESVSIRQSALDRFLGIGTVMLHLKDGARERLAGLKNPDVIQRKLEALLPHAKQT